MMSLNTYSMDELDLADTLSSSLVQNFIGGIPHET